MSPHLAAALGNARHRAQLGWPLALLAIGLYAPNVGPARLVVLAAGLVFLARRPAGTPPTKARTTARPVTHRQPTAPNPKPVRTPAKPTKAARPRSTNGRFQ